MRLRLSYDPCRLFEVPSAEQSRAVPLMSSLEGPTQPMASSETEIASCLGTNLYPTVIMGGPQRPLSKQTTPFLFHPVIHHAPYIFSAILLSTLFSQFFSSSPQPSPNSHLLSSHPPPILPIIFLTHTLLVHHVRLPI